VESNERYYRRRAVEERMAAQRAVTETARAWHSHLAENFAERASACTGITVQATVAINV
jgi:anti-sigma-K factor RskA